MRASTKIKVSYISLHQNFIKAKFKSQQNHGLQITSRRCVVVKKSKSNKLNWGNKLLKKTEKKPLPKQLRHNQDN